MKHVHFIGICGVAMGGIAIAFKKAGWQVTGSDAGFFPPVSTHLKNAGIEFYPGWHPDRVGQPDLVIVGNVAGSQNPEWQYVQEKKLPYKSYPEALAEFFVKKNSIVCAGTYGKTTTSALLAWILTLADFAPSYMFGGLPVNEFDSARISKSDWSVIEGDEYKSARWDTQPKFAHYSPTHLLLTAVKWDHAEIYPTEKSYFDVFKKLIAQIPASGKIIACADDAKAKKMAPQAIFYGKNRSAKYRYSKIKQTKDGIAFEIQFEKQKFQVTSPMLGEHTAENICGAFAMAVEIGITPEKIISAIASFAGIKRRMEKRGQLNGADVYDDIAHSPAKAQSVLENLAQVYKVKIYAIFEPNTGNRSSQSAPGYQDCFKKASQVIVPALTKLKSDPNQKIMDGAELVKIIGQSHQNIIYIEEDPKLLAYLRANVKKEDVVVFLGSHGFRGMIDQIISPHQQSQP